MLTENTTYTPAANPIIIDVPLQISVGVSLIIEAGCIIRFEGNGTLLIKGDLYVRGTEQNPVQFEGTQNTTAISIMDHTAASATVFTHGFDAKWEIRFAEFNGLGTGISLASKR